MRALIDPNGMVAQIEIETFPVHESWQWVDAPPGTKPGWTYDGTFHAPPPVIPTPPEDTPTTPSDIERALIAKGLISASDIAAAKRGR